LIAVPKRYSDDERSKVIDHLCSEITEGRALAAILREDQILNDSPESNPSHDAVSDWLDQSDDFKRRIERAREAGAEKLLGEIIDIADNATGDVYIDEKGQPRIDGDCVQRAKLKVYAREAYAKKIAPKRFGDRIDMTSGGEKLPAPAPATLVQIADNRVQTLIALAAQRKAEKDRLLDNE
jgi:hypothetical protein